MGRSPCCLKEGLKKGPWTQEEDEKLIAFVTQHGHGNWRALPKKCDLLRCGKSCRLRWNNYLRPDIKRGLFTQSEEQKIIQLHALVGNKWAFIASQLPKRTDNEIKNYWNTVLKKRLEKLGLSSLISMGGAGRTERRTPAMAGGAERPVPQESNKRQAENNIKSASKKATISNNSASVMSCTHLAQWENARLEAEARLTKESQSSKLGHKLLSFAYKGHSFSSCTSTNNTAFSSLISNHSTIYTNQQSQPPQLSTTNSSIASILVPSSSISNPCLIHTLNPLSNASSTLHAIVSSCSSSSTSSSTILSSKSFSSLASQESNYIAASPLKLLAPSGRLSWQQQQITKEMPFTTSPSTISHAASQSSLLSQLLCQIERHENNGQEIELQASTREGLNDNGQEIELKANRGQLEQLNMEEATSNSLVDLNSTILESSKDLNSTIENWHDFIFDVENSCSDVVSTTNWKGAMSPQREEFTHDSTSLIKSGSHGTLDLEGLNLFHFDSLNMSCDHYANQHSNVLMKELLWDTSPTTLSISSTSIVN